MSKNPNVQNFYRYFEVPGLAHCAGGLGGQPVSTFDLLRAWVENGTAPDTLPLEYYRADGRVETGSLCPYPDKPVYKFGSNSSVIDGCAQQKTA